MDCACDEWPATVQTSDFVRARKPWKCSECYREIARGEHYQKWSTLFEGSWSREEVCADCARVSDALHAALRIHNAKARAERDAAYRERRQPTVEEVCDCWCWGELWEHVAEFCREVLGYDPAGTLELSSVEQKEKR